MEKLRAAMLCLVAMGFSACGSQNGSSTIPPQTWNNLVVRIETHPSPPESGMSEIVVVITGPHGKPAGDLTVSLRGDESQPWIQAIQDGFIGVYRRAIDLGDGQTAIVRVKLQNEAMQKTLLFPIKLAPG